jgi:hypothetical protein
MEEEEETSSSSVAGNTMTSSAVPGVTKEDDLGEERKTPHGDDPDPPAREPPDLRKLHPPETGTSKCTITNQSSSCKSKTLIDFFSTTKTQENPTPHQ